MFITSIAGVLERVLVRSLYQAGAIYLKRPIMTSSKVCLIRVQIQTATRIVVAAMLCSGWLSAHAQWGADDFNPGANDTVRAIVVQDDGLRVNCPVPPPPSIVKSPPTMTHRRQFCHRIAERA